MTQVESRCTQKTASSLSVEVGDRRTPSLTDRRVLVGEVSRTSSSSSYEHRGTTHVTHRESGGGRGRERERERETRLSCSSPNLELRRRWSYIIFRTAVTPAIRRCKRDGRLQDWMAYYIQRHYSTGQEGGSVGRRVGAGVS